MTSGVPYAEVIGDPIAHSKSPLIHRFWLEQLGIKGHYRARQVRRGELASYIAERASDPLWRGCNVTMPLKREALSAAGERRDRAADAGAANLLLPDQNDVLIADNSDVSAIERLLDPHLASAGEAVVHLIGTGGAAAAAAAAIWRSGRPTNVFTYARSEESALAFREAAGLEPSPLLCHVLGEASPWGSAGDVVINATPLGMRDHPQLPFSLEDFTPGALVFDMVYDPLETPLLAEARSRNMAVIDGLQMLVEQAAYSFSCFFGAEPPRDRDNALRELLTA
jgi:shikimate dehydrogenase